MAVKQGPGLYVIVACQALRFAHSWSWVRGAFRLLVPRDGASLGVGGPDSLRDSPVQLRPDTDPENWLRHKQWSKRR